MYLCKSEGRNFFKWEKVIRYKDSHLAIGKEICWIKRFKNGVGQGFIFHAIFLRTILLGENFISKVKSLYI